MANSARSRTASLVATCFGLGYSPFAPGTAGSLGALALAWVLARFWGWQPVHFALLACVAFLPAVWAAQSFARASGKHDPGAIVVDEAVGQWIALFGAAPLTWQAWLAAFALFRIFDIWKPQPVRRAESLPGGWGIVADDVAAGLYAALVLFLAGCFNLY